MSIVTIRAVDRPEVHANTIALLRKHSGHLMSGVLYLGGGRPISVCYDVDRKLIDHPSVRAAHAAGLITLTDRNTGENLPIGAPADINAPAPASGDTTEVVEEVKAEVAAPKAPRAPRQPKPAKDEPAQEPSEAPADVGTQETGE